MDQRTGTIGDAPHSALSGHAPARRTGQEAGRQVVSLSVFRFDGLASRLWAFGQMGLARRPLSRTPGIGFAKLMGTGSGLNFDPWPNFGVWAILATWPDAATARAAMDRGVFRRFRARAAEQFTVYLAPIHSTGRWSGFAPFEAARSESPPAPLAVLTRASVKPRHARAFWRKVPAINAQIGAAPAMLFRMGMGEVPWLHQVTFSIWQSAEAMRAFAYRGDGHRTAIADARAGDWFTEELFARFAVISHDGTWEGRDSLA
ncbi:spheroidene monooxygenase [Limibaculum sp. FT325]|uniref:spheroidene monooxygenase n=1 Tax=Thermohalobaculum sediminis TaxID=2939436 RepID=UPI0020BDCD7C|nr:spheroidene monooxygenase [Limibaculum sediminis]MCL5778598.1 spheroidene monooxygenase [Limibaculum sediminis]